MQGYLIDDINESGSKSRPPRACEPRRPDLMHAAAVQFPEPAVSIAFDTDRKSGRRRAQEGLCRRGEKWISGWYHRRLVPRRRPPAQGGKGDESLPVNDTSLK